jgi:tRNA G26 N,N-dimethylase Trm1
MCCFSHVLYVKILVKFNKRLAKLVEFTQKKQKLIFSPNSFVKKEWHFARKENTATECIFTPPLFCGRFKKRNACSKGYSDVQNTPLSLKKIRGKILKIKSSQVFALGKPLAAVVTGMEPIALALIPSAKTW